MYLKSFNVTKTHHVVAAVKSELVDVAYL